jgi:hypothetical protein
MNLKGCSLSIPGKTNLEFLIQILRTTRNIARITGSSAKSLTENTRNTIPVGQNGVTPTFSTCDRPLNIKSRILSRFSHYTCVYLGL